MAVIWETVDRLGRQVVLTENQWAHVVFEHDYMVHRIHEVQYAVAFADEVARDRSYAHRDIHYWQRGSGALCLRVVVHYRPRDPSGWTGEVRTAHFITRKPRGEALLWPSKSTS